MGILGASLGIYIAWEDVNMVNVWTLISSFVLVAVWIVRLAFL